MLANVLPKNVSKLDLDLERSFSDFHFKRVRAFKKRMCVERRLLSDISEPARARRAQNLRCALQGGGPMNSSGIMISSDETGGARVVCISTLDRSPLLGMCVESIS